MKKEILFLASMFIGLISFAQSESEHLTFKGVPIDGTIGEFVKKMEDAGFSYVGTEDGLTVLQGDFAGYKNCAIGVSTLQSVNAVSTIAVLFPICTEWSCLEQKYEYIKSMLSKKYGEPTIVVECFQGDYKPTTNNEKLTALFLDKCTWQTKYETPKGNIELSIQKGDYGQYLVGLKYFDRINTEKVDSSVIDDL